MKKFIKPAIGIGSLLAPAIVFAQNTSAFDILTVISRIFKILIPLLIILGVIYFFWTVIS